MQDLMDHGLRVLAAHAAWLHAGLTLGGALALLATLVVFACIVRSGQLHRLEERLADEHALHHPWCNAAVRKVHPSPVGPSWTDPVASRWPDGKERSCLY